MLVLDPYLHMWALVSGEDVGHYGGSYKVSLGLYKKYGKLLLRLGCSLYA